jgi:hypothetical protein
VLGSHAAVILAESMAWPGFKSFFRWIFVQQMTYTISISLNKFTILAFYGRLFSVKVRWPIYMMSFIVFGWLISMSVQPLPLTCLVRQANHALRLSCRYIYV